MTQVGSRPSLVQNETTRERWLWAVLAFALLFPTLSTWLYFIRFAGSPAVRFIYGVGKVLQFCFPALYVILIEGKEAQGVTRAVRAPAKMTVGRSVATGLLLGLTVAALLAFVYTYFFREHNLFDSTRTEILTKLRDAKVDSPGRFLALAVFYSVVHSLLEEYYWRWFVFGRLRLLLSLWPAVALSSLGFMAHHTIVIGKYFGGVTLMTVLFSAAVAVGGAIWAWLYEQSQSLFGPWLSHLVVDSALMAVGYHMIWGWSIG